jgi:hypothetical protein
MPKPRGAVEALVGLEEGSNLNLSPTDRVAALCAQEASLPERDRCLIALNAIATHHDGMRA